MQLIGTSVNLIEIAWSGNLIKDFIKVKRTIQALRKYHYQIISSNPVDHMICIFDPQFESDDSKADIIINDLNIIESFGSIDDLSNADLLDLLHRISKRVQDKIYISDLITKVLHSSQNVVKHLRIKDNYKINSFSESWKPFFVILMNRYRTHKYGEEFDVRLEDDRWNNLNFFLTVWDDFFKHLEVSPGSKFKKNTLHDLLNLVYVQPGSKYWTSEKRSWAKVMRDNIKTKQYLYNS